MDFSVEKCMELLKELISKGITVGLTVFLSNEGVDVLMNYAFAQTPETALAIKGVSLIVAYSVWTKAVVPFIVGILAGEKITAGKGPKKDLTGTVRRFEL